MSLVPVSRPRRLVYKTFLGSCFDIFTLTSAIEMFTVVLEPSQKSTKNQKWQDKTGFEIFIRDSLAAAGPRPDHLLVLSYLRC